MSRPVWKAAIATIEYRVCATVVGVVAPRTASPAATSAIPPYWRRWSSKPKRRSASTASTTKPPAITACATESGANPMAPTWNTQPTTATAQPIAHHLDRNSCAALLIGARRLTAGAATAPRCFHRNPRFVATAVATANARPMSSRSSIVRSREGDTAPIVSCSRRLRRSNATRPRVLADRQDGRASTPAPRPRRQRKGPSTRAPGGCPPHRGGAVSARAVFVARSRARVGCARSLFAQRSGQSARSGGAGGDAGVVEEQPVRVVQELAGKPEPRSGVAVALSPPVVVEANVALFEPFDAEIRGADVNRGRLRVAADRESQTTNGKGVGQCRGFEIDVEAAVESRSRRAVDLPVARSITGQADLGPAGRRATCHESATRRPSCVETDRVLNHPRLAVLDGGRHAIDAGAAAVRVQEHDLKAGPRVAVLPRGEGGRNAEGHDDLSRHGLLRFAQNGASGAATDGKRPTKNSRRRTMLPGRFDSTRRHIGSVSPSRNDPGAAALAPSQASTGSGRATHRG